MTYTALFARNIQHFLGLPLLLLLLLLVGGLALFSMKPTEIVIASGPEGGYFHATALRYQQALEARGVPVRVIGEENSLESLEQVDNPDSGVNVGFLAQRAQAGDYPLTRSLGVINDEPLFIFRRTELGPITRLQDLVGRRLAVGPERSGTRQLVDEVLAAHQIDSGNADLRPLKLKDAGRALEQHEVDVAFFLQPLEQPLIHQLGRAPHIRLIDVVEAKAIARLMGGDRNMGVATIPHGIFDLGRELPLHDVQLPTEAVSVVVKQDLDPAVMHHLLMVMKEVHGGAGVDREAGRYPRAVATQVPLHPAADSFYRDGLPLLYQYLPFGFANGLFQTVKYLLPLGIISPVFSFLGFPPPMWFYKELRFRLWLIEMRHMQRQFEAGAELSPRQLQRLRKLRLQLAGEDTALDRCREAVRNLP